MKTFSNTPATFKRKAEDEDDDLEAKGKHLPYAESQMQISSIRVHLDEPVKEPSYYRAIVDRLSTLTSNDQVTFFIASPGGHLDGLVSLLHAVKYTDANVQCVIVGEALSAASFFALSCPTVAVSDNASMMVHFVQFGVSGKASDVHARTQFNMKYCENLFKETYKGFMSESEIQQCLDGKEFWFDSAEIIKRLEAREKLKNKPVSTRKPRAKTSED
jgi:ATP-dependent protease ClpP protease subunit